MCLELPNTDHYICIVICYNNKEPMYLTSLNPKMEFDYPNIREPLLFRSKKEAAEIVTNHLIEFARILSIQELQAEGIFAVEIFPDKDPVYVRIV